jgi:hypothetical protein
MEKGRQKREDGKGWQKRKVVKNTQKEVDGKG